MLSKPLKPMSHKVSPYKIYWKGALIAPFFAPLSLYIASFFIQLVRGKLGDDVMEWLVHGPIMILAWGGIIGYPVMLLLGLPYVYWLRSRDSLSIEFVCGGALVLGAVVNVIFVWISDFNISLLSITLFSSMALITAYAFCRIEGIVRQSS